MRNCAKGRQLWKSPDGCGVGGCSVHLVLSDGVATVKEAWEKECYSKLSLAEEEQKEDVVVVSKPGSGSVVHVVEGEGVS
jgi:galactokinase